MKLLLKCIFFQNKLITMFGVQPRTKVDRESFIEQGILQFQTMFFRQAFVLLSLATAVQCAVNAADVPSLISLRLQYQFNAIADKGDLRCVYLHTRTAAMLLTC